MCAQTYIVVGLGLDAVGAILIVVPLLTMIPSEDNIATEDQRKQAKLLACLGVIFLVGGFGLQVVGNLA